MYLWKPSNLRTIPELRHYGFSRPNRMLLEFLFLFFSCPAMELVFVYRKIGSNAFVGPDVIAGLWAKCIE